MTDRTSGITFNYKLLGSTGERKKVSRSRNTIPSNHSTHKGNSLSEAEPSTSVRSSTPIHTAGNFDFEDIVEVEEEQIAATGVPNPHVDLSNLSEEESLALAFESLVLSGEESPVITDTSLVSTSEEGSTLTDPTVILQVEENSTLTQADAVETMGDNLAIQEVSIGEDIDDFIEENPLIESKINLK